MQIKGPHRTFNVVVKDSESKIIHFEDELTSWFKNNKPKRIRIGTIRLIQDEIQYFHECGNSKTWGTIDEYGSISFKVSIPPESFISPDTEGREKHVKIISIEEEASFLVGILQFIKSVYEKIEYSSRIEIKYIHHNVEQHRFSSTNIRIPAHYREDYIQQSEFEILRSVSIDSLDMQKLAESCLEEMANVCNWSTSERNFQSYVSDAIKQLDHSQSQY